MFRTLVRASLCVALILGTLLTGGSAHAAAPAPKIRIIAERFIAYDLEESGHDEIYLSIQHDGGNQLRFFPTDDYSPKTIDENNCYFFYYGLIESCGDSIQNASFSTYFVSTLYPADGKLVTVTLMEDDLVGDDTLVSIPISMQPISETKHIHREMQTNNFHYALNIRLEPDYS